MVINLMDFGPSELNSGDKTSHGPYVQVSYSGDKSSLWTFGPSELKHGDKFSHGPLVQVR